MTQKLQTTKIIPEIRFHTLKSNAHGKDPNSQWSQKNYFSEMRKKIRMLWKRPQIFRAEKITKKKFFLYFFILTEGYERSLSKNEEVFQKLSPF